MNLTDTLYLINNTIHNELNHKMPKELSKIVLQYFNNNVYKINKKDIIGLSTEAPYRFINENNIYEVYNYNGFVIWKIDINNITNMEEIYYNKTEQCYGLFYDNDDIYAISRDNVYTIGNKKIFKHYQPAFYIQTVTKNIIITCKPTFDELYSLTFTDGDDRFVYAKEIYLLNLKTQTQKQIYKTKYNIKQVKYHDNLLYLLVQKNLCDFIVIIGKVVFFDLVVIDQMPFRDKNYDPVLSVICAGIFVLKMSDDYYIYKNEKLKGRQKIPKYFSCENFYIDLDKTKVTIC